MARFAANGSPYFRGSVASMRALFLLVAGSVALGWTAVPALADVQSYCEAYARHEAEARISGSAILGGKSRVSAEARNERKALALADCLALYEPKTKVEPAKAVSPVNAESRLRKQEVAVKPPVKLEDDPWKTFDNPDLSHR